jgi:hypothetical protein
MAVEGAGAKLVPVGPPHRYEEVANHPQVTLANLASRFAGLLPQRSIAASGSAA